MTGGVPGVPGGVPGVPGGVPGVLGGVLGVPGGVCVCRGGGVMWWCDVVVCGLVARTHARKAGSPPTLQWRSKATIMWGGGPPNPLEPPTPWPIRSRPTLAHTEPPPAPTA